MSRLREFYTALDARSPRIAAFARRLYHGRLLNSARKKITGQRNLIEHAGAILSSVTFDICGNGNTVHIGHGSFLNRVTFFIRGDHHRVSIGRNCRFNRGSLLWLEDETCTLSIGDNSTFEDVHIAVTEPGSTITIGSDCMFANDIDVRNGDSHAIFPLDSRERINPPKDVTIEDHVWVAAHSVILKGAHLLANTVVATGAVVTKSPRVGGVILAGNPAAVIREGITWTRER